MKPKKEPDALKAMRDQYIHDKNLPDATDEPGPGFECEAWRNDSMQLGRIATLINSAFPNFKSAMGSEADHAECAIAAFIVEDGATCEIAHKPGSQGVRIVITGARKI